MASKLYGVAKVRNTTKNAWCLQWNMVVAVSLCGAAWVLLVSGSCISLMASWIHKCTALYWKRRCYHHSVPLVVVQHDNDPMVQNAAARLLTGAKKHDHITPILASLHWLPVSFRIQFKIVLIVFKALNGQAPSYISDLISFKSTSKPLRSANKVILCVPRSRLKFKGDRAFAVAAPRLWNQLPPDIKSAPSISVFKSRLKMHLYSMAFPEF